MAPADCVAISGRMLGPREYEVLQLLCAHGPATVRELLRTLSAEPPIAYQTLMTICVRLLEKGLVERRVAVSATDILRYGKAYIYTPLVHDVIELQPIVPTSPPSAATWEIRARQAEMHVEALEQRAIAAERRAAEAEQRVQVLLKELAGTPRPGRPPQTSHVDRGPIVEHADRAGICRVCGKKAPPPSAARHDNLRVCRSESCRAEARRRDGVAKQRRYNARQATKRTAALVDAARSEQGEMS